jgi:hypothetical protein
VAHADTVATDTSDAEEEALVAQLATAIENATCRLQVLETEAAEQRRREVSGLFGAI